MPLESDIAYRCPYCGEENYVGIDPTGGSRQKLIEDCPVCCSPIEFAVSLDRDGTGSVEVSQA